MRHIPGSHQIHKHCQTIPDIGKDYQDIHTSMPLLPICEFCKNAHTNDWFEHLKFFLTFLPRFLAVSHYLKPLAGPEPRLIVSVHQASILTCFWESSCSKNRVTLITQTLQPVPNLLPYVTQPAQTLWIAIKAKGQ